MDNFVSYKSLFFGAAIIVGLFLYNLYPSLFTLFLMLSLVLFVLYLKVYYEYHLQKDLDETGVLPSLEPTQKGEGKICINPQSESLTSIKDIKSLMTPAIWVLCTLGPSLGILYVVIAVILQGNVTFSNVFEIVFSPFLLLIFGWVLVIGFGIYWAKKLIRRIKTIAEEGSGKLFVDRWPLNIGEQVNATFECQVPSNHEIANVTPSLVCVSSYEWLKDEPGLNDWTIFNYEFPSFKIGKTTNGSSTREISFSIPRFAPPSFERSDHKYEWFLNFDFENKSFPNDSSKFKLLVLPEVSIKNGE